MTPVQAQAGQLMLGIVIGVPEPFESVLRSWRVELGDPLALGTPPHITVLPPTPVDPGQLPSIEAHLRRAGRSCEPFEVYLSGTDTFLPVSPVTFVRVEQGEQGCRQVEAAVRRDVLERALSFPYHPHLTVAHQVDEQQLRRGLRELADFHARFTVSSFRLYVHDADQVWRLHEQFPLGAPA